MPCWAAEIVQQFRVEWKQFFPCPMLMQFTFALLVAYDDVREEARQKITIYSDQVRAAELRMECDTIIIV